VENTSKIENCETAQEETLETKLLREKAKRFIEKQK